MSNKWYEAKIESVHPMVDDLTVITLDVRGTPLVGAHKNPGQHVKLSVEGAGEAYFAIASSPDAHGYRFEFLVKGGSPLADTLSKLPPGSWVRISTPGGKGFPLERAKGKTLLLFASGAGISAIRSVVGAIRTERQEYRNVTLYFGARTPSSFAYENELARWQKEGIRVVQTVSQPGNSGWKGLTGYVQSHIEEFPVNDTVAFLCGRKEMVREVTSALVHHGLLSENVFLNY